MPLDLVSGFIFGDSCGYMAQCLQGCACLTPSFVVEDGVQLGAENKRLSISFQSVPTSCPGHNRFLIYDKLRNQNQESKQYCSHSNSAEEVKIDQARIAGTRNIFFEILFRFSVGSACIIAVLLFGIV